MSRFNIEGVTNRESNYCIKCMHEFTTLTEQERLNLELLNRKLHPEKFAYQFKAKTKFKRKLYCLDTGDVFRNVHEASKRLKISTTTIYDSIRGMKSKWQFEWRFEE